MYLHEMEAGKPKPALPEDVAKLEARAKSNPSLRPPSKPPAKAASPAGIPTVKMLRTPVGEFDFSIYYDCQEVDLFPDEPFYDCQKPPEVNHPISDTGDINPTVKTSTCVHMWRTMKTMRVPLMQSNRYANWVRCPACGHTHVTITYSATCCLRRKRRHNEIVDTYKHQKQLQSLAQPRQPPIDALNVTRECPWTKWGLLLSQFLFRMTPAYLNAITTAKEELNAKRARDPNGPWGDYNPRPESVPMASAVAHLCSLKAKTSDEQYCMLDSGANVLAIPWKPGMKGEKTMCTLVGEIKQKD